MKGPSVIETDRAIWDAMLAHLRAHNPTICRQWFEELAPLGVGGGALQLRTLSSLHRDYLRRQCADAFNDAARTVSGRLLSVRFLGPEDEVIAPPPAPARKATALHRQAEADRDPATHRGEPVAREAGFTNGHGPEAVPKIGGRPGGESAGWTSGGSLPDPRHGRVESSAGASAGAKSEAKVDRIAPRPGSADRGERSEAEAAALSAADRSGEQARPDASGAELGGADLGGGELGGGEFGGGDVGGSEPPLVVVPSRAPQPSPERGPEGSPARALPVEPEPARGARSWSGPVPQRYESLVVNPDNAFDTFVVGPGNRLAHAAAMAVVGNPGRVYNPFFVHGGVGLGKTHLLQAVCLRLVEANPRLVLYYTSCENFVTQYVESVQSGEMSEFRHRFRDVDVLVIDDIHFLSKRDQSQEEFFHTFNRLHQSHKQIILSSDAPPEDIPQLEERLVSRFKWGLVAKIEPPSYETRVEILKTKARLRGLEMPAAVAEYIAGRLDTNIRELEGAVVKLQIQAVVEKRPIDLDLARAALGDVPAPVVGEPTIQSIIDAVTEHYSIRLADLQSKHRQRSIALPRQVCMFLARRCTRHSLEEIGGFFGGRDHTTVMHAIRTVEDRRVTDAEFENVLRVLEERVRAGKA